MSEIISDGAIKRREYWIEEIRKLSGHFGNDTDKLEQELDTEVQKMEFLHLLTTCAFAETYLKATDTTQVKKSCIRNTQTVYFLWPTQQ